MTRPLLQPAKFVLEMMGISVERIGTDVLLLNKAADDARRQDAMEGWVARRHLRRLLDMLSVDCVLDVGANEGGFASLVRSAGWRGRIVSFEPQSGCRAVLDRRAAADPAWSVLPIALSDHEGKSELVLRVSSQLASLNALNRGSRVAAGLGSPHALDETGTESIVRRRLDTVLPELAAPPVKRALLKIDTQGHDEQVLAGASLVLNQVVAIQMELTQDPLYFGTSHYTKVLDVLRQLGFGLSAAVPVIREKKTGLMVEFDGLFVRVDSPDRAP